MAPPKDMQTLPRPVESTDNNSLSNPDSPDAVLNIDSGFGPTIHEEPGMRRSANCWMSHLVSLDVQIHSGSAVAGLTAFCAQQLL